MIASARTSPTNAPVQKPNCWAWAQPLKLGGIQIELQISRLTPGTLRLLEKLSSHELRWKRVAYEGWTAKEKRQIGRRVRCLRKSKLAEVSVRKRRSNLFCISTGNALDMHGTDVWIRPLASCRKRKDGTHTLYATEEARMAIEARNTRGGKRLGAGRKRKSKASLSKAPDEGVFCPKCTKAHKTPLDEVDGAEKSKASPKASSDVCICSDLSEGEDDESSVPAASSPEQKSDEGSTGFDPDSVADLSQNVRREKLPLEKRGPRPSIPGLDRPAVKYPDLRIRIPEMLPDVPVDSDYYARLRELQVAALVNGYDGAVRRVYGGRGFFCKDITRSKIYPALLKAVDVMVAEDIPPGEWAEWRLREAKKQGAWRKPWPLGRVFQPKVVHRLRGYFRHAAKTSPDAVQDWKPWHNEQLYRTREAELTWIWGANPPMLAFPQWYTKMRAAEIKQGCVDPLELWQSPRNTGRERLRR